MNVFKLLTVTVLAWGMIQFEEGYQTAGEWDNAIDQIKWVTDYLIKAEFKNFLYFFIS